MANESSVFKDVCIPRGYNASLGPNGTSQNSSITAGSSALCWSLSLDARIGLVSMYALIFIFGVPGNFVVCYVLGRKKETRLGSNFFIIALAATDLLASILMPLLHIPGLLSKDGRWYFGASICKLLPTFSPMTLIVSAWTLVLIAGDRYRVIVHPMKPRISITKKCIGLLLVWLFAFGNAMPYMLSIGMQDGKYCRVISGKVMTVKELTSYNWVWMAGNWILPMVILCVLYSRCMKKLRNNKLKYSQNETMKKRADENKRVVKMLSIVVIAFFMLTIPYTLFYMGMSYMVAYAPQHMNLILILTLNYALSLLTSINSCVNPFIYARMHKEINAVFKEKLSCCRSRSDCHSRNNGNVKRGAALKKMASFSNKAFEGEKNEKAAVGIEENIKVESVFKRKNATVNNEACSAKESQNAANSTQETGNPVDGTS